MLNSIAFIPDGNRRYAKLKKIGLFEAYRLGVKKAWQTIRWLEEYPSITTGTFYALSLKNLRRHKTELKLLFRIFEQEFEKVKKTDYFERKGVRTYLSGSGPCLFAPYKEGMEGIWEGAVKVRTI